MQKRSRMPRDAAQLAKAVLDMATGETKPEEPEEVDPVTAAARALGRLGGLKGGKARAQKLSAKRRREIARAAARHRWANSSPSTAEEE